MIYVTGDTHGEIDFHKLKVFVRKTKKTLTKNDYLLICGDFGGVWQEETMRKSLDMYSNLPFTVLFVDGNHENYTLLRKFPLDVWKGGKVRFIRKDILYLQRGQVFEVDGKRILTLGGAHSWDKDYRQPGISWWQEEDITLKDVEEAEKNLLPYHNKVDYVITHCCDSKTLLSPALKDNYKSDRILLENEFLYRIDRETEYEKWYFGHYHIDAECSEKKRALYQDVIPIGD